MCSKQSISSILDRIITIIYFRVAISVCIFTIFIFYQLEYIYDDVKIVCFHLKFLIILVKWCLIFGRTNATIHNFIEGCLILCLIDSTLLIGIGISIVIHVHDFVTPEWYNILMLIYCNMDSVTTTMVVTNAYIIVESSDLETQFARHTNTNVNSDVFIVSDALRKLEDVGKGSIKMFYLFISLCYNGKIKIYIYIYI